MFVNTDVCRDVFLRDSAACMTVILNNTAQREKAFVLHRPSPLLAYQPLSQTRVNLVDFSQNTTADITVSANIPF